MTKGNIPPKRLHGPKANKGENMSANRGKEPGRRNEKSSYRSARDATGINPEAREPIDPESPHIPPA